MVDETSGPGLDRVAIVQVGAIVPTRPQLAVRDAAKDVDLMGAHVPTVERRSGRFSDLTEPRRALFRTLSDLA